jgi:hypothetical protein
MTKPDYTILTEDQKIELLTLQNATIEDRDEDLKEIGQTVFKMLGTLGMDVSDLKSPDNETPKEAKKRKSATKKKVLNSLKEIISDMMFGGSSIEERFAFLSEFEPILIKHKSLIDEIQSEKAQ